MTAADLLHSLAGRGVRLEARDGRLRVDAPAGALTAEDRQALACLKRELLTLLAGALAPDPTVRPLAPPPGARMFFERRDGRPCGPGDDVRLWTWEGARCWYYAEAHPPPGATKERVADIPPSGSGANTRG